jgi:hypothetical protein
MDEIYGRYELENGSGTECVTLNKDGTYFQDYTSKDGMTHVTQTDGWTYEPEKSELNLHNPLLIYDMLGKLNDPTHFQTKGIYGYGLTREFGQIRININEDSGVYLKKL